VKLYPAIDILDGRAVRLRKGDFDASTVYDEDPLSAARAWVQAGAQRLHVVDLDGARAGEPVNLEHLRRISQETGVPVQYGGGLRSRRALEDALAAGAARVVLGTAAFADGQLLEQALARHGEERVAVAVDVRSGEVVVHGWMTAAGVGVREVFAELIGRGARELVYTNVDRDGMLEGPNVDDLVWVAKAAAQGRLIYSGGIGALDDLKQLAQLRDQHALENLEGVIVGKALYERRFSVAEALAVLGG